MDEKKIKLRKLIPLYEVLSPTFAITHLRGGLRWHLSFFKNITFLEADA